MELLNLTRFICEPRVLKNKAEKAKKQKIEMKGGVFYLINCEVQYARRF